MSVLFRYLGYIFEYKKLYTHEKNQSTIVTWYFFSWIFSRKYRLSRAPKRDFRTGKCPRNS
ncbi:hypothetical protein T190130A13A_30391 [Tenacibaculum sp. 190130A14a]|uniref:Uncharacterized protein n=1 Tax=Tenacibaculum polynesiense TaxID=3137857 RepID=A0ABM9PCQ0_9FLAO